MKMLTRNRRVVWLWAVWMLLAVPAAGWGQDAVGLPDWGGGAEAPKPEISVSAASVPAGQAFEIFADFKLDDTVKLYRDQLVFTWDTLQGAEVIETIKPASKRVPDRGAGNPDELVEVYEKAVRIIVRLKATGEPGSRVTAKGRLAHQACTDLTCFLPATEPFAFDLEVTEPTGPPVATTGPTAAAADPPVELDGQRQEINLWLELLTAFLWGIGIGFTPCVYPMIPVTAAIIGAKKDRGLLSALGASITYVLGMALVYAILGMVVSMIGARAATVLRSWYVLVPVAAVFVALALTMLAGWNLAAPSGVMQRVQGMLAGKKGVLSVFALGAVGGLVAGPCVLAPLFAQLQRVFALGDPLVGFLAMFVVALGLGVPLILFATGTGLLPKAGPWMEWVKNLMGFVLLWAAAYFLIPVIGDTAYYLAFAAVLVVGAVFLGGFDRLTRESSAGDRAKRALGMLALLAAVFLTAHALGFGGGGTAEKAENLFVPGSMSDVQRVLDAGQPFIIDFTADWCVICKELDRTVFTQPDVLARGGRFTAIKIDIDEHPDVAKKYNVKSPPVIVFVNADGSVNRDLSFAGGLGKEAFLEKLDRFGQ